MLSRFPENTGNDTAYLDLNPEGSLETTSPTGEKPDHRWTRSWPGLTRMALSG